MSVIYFSIWIFLYLLFRIDMFYGSPPPPPIKHTLKSRLNGKFFMRSSIHTCTIFLYGDATSLATSFANFTWGFLEYNYYSFPDLFRRYFLRFISTCKYDQFWNFFHFNMDMEWAIDNGIWYARADGPDCVIITCRYIHVYM